MKYFVMILMAAAGMLLAGCSDSPEDVTRKWIEALAEGDAVKANGYSTENVRILNSIVAASVQNGLELDKLNQTLADLDDAKVEINGDIANIAMKDGRIFTLKKVDSDWKVDVGK